LPGEGPSNPTRWRADRTSNVLVLIGDGLTNRQIGSGCSSPERR
jgi:hypothetical protein